MGRPKKEGGMSATDYKRAFNEKTMIVFPRMLSAGKRPVQSGRRRRWV